MIRAFDKRISALEEAMPDISGRVDLDRLSTAELERLESILIAKEGGRAIEDMPDDELRFLAGLRII